MRNKKDLKYIALLVSTVLVFVLIEVLTPKPIDWTVTLSKKDKIPFGTFVLHDLFSGFFDGKEVTHSYETLYEQQDNINGQNVFILTNYFSPDEADAEVLLEKIEQGATAFIAAQYFGGLFADTLNIKVDDDLSSLDLDNINPTDSSYFVLSNSDHLTSARFRYQKSHFPTHFSSIDTVNSTVTIQNKNGDILGVKIIYGQGTIYLCTTPMAFTNNYLLAKNNDAVISGLLSYLPNSDMLWTEYYHLGRMESGSPLRFILKNPALRWAYYLSLIGLMVLFFFETKRRQRAIPVIAPYPNSSLEFVGVIGNLYLQNNEHKKIADKRISFFLDQIRRTYFIQKITYDDVFYEMLAAKSGNTPQAVKEVFVAIEKIQSLPSITAEQLQKLSIKIDQITDHKSNKHE